MEQLVKNKEYDYIEREKIIDLLCQRFGVTKLSAGKSALGKSLTAIKIGEGVPVLFAGGFHGSERITSTLLLYFVEQLLCHMDTDKIYLGLRTDRIFKNRSLVILPCVNPDGCDIALLGESAAGANADFIRKISKGNTFKYNANARGVDINHNFPAGWRELHRLEQKNGILGPATTRYGGERAASESETVALMDFCKKQGFIHALAFHSQGEVIYHRYGAKTPIQSAKMATLMSVSSGYSLEEPTGLAVGGGFKDWFIDFFGRPAFTVEVGKGENPLPASSLYEIYAKIAQMLLFSVMM